MRQDSGYASVVGRPKTADPLAAQYAFRTSAEVRRSFLEWLVNVNAGRAIPISEADALRLLVTWAARTRPNFDELNRAAAPTAPVWYAPSTDKASVSTAPKPARAEPKAVDTAADTKSYIIDESESQTAPKRKR